VSAVTAVAAPKRNRKRLTPGRVLLHGFLLVTAVLWLIPVVWAVFTSFRSYGDTAIHGYVSWPHHLSLVNYKEAWTRRRSRTSFSTR
jgi:multiple sugar transport system permease protein